jgi:hypothetical protein
MQPADTLGDIQAALSGVKTEFELCARRAIEWLLNEPTLLCKAVSPEGKPFMEASFRCAIESGNDDHSVGVSLEIAETDLAALFPDEQDLSMRMDAVGEIMNVLAGSLFKSTAFHSRFGCMRASVPVFKNGGGPAERAGNLFATIRIKSAELHLHLAVDDKKPGRKP